MTSNPLGGKPAVDPTKPFGYREWEDAKELLLDRYPFIHYECIGHSVAGRELGAFRIGSGPREIHYNGGMHANEWITSMLIMTFLGELAEASSRNSSIWGQNAEVLLSRSSLWLTPLINPDGTELAVRGLCRDDPMAGRLLEWNGGRTDFSSWKANMNGVDLNDQFPANWETERSRRDVAGPGPRDYTGEAPLTEPEAKALAAFTSRQSFALVIAFHTQGREIYWNYRNKEPAESLVWADRFGRVSGYIPVKLEGSDAGYKDWFIQEFGRPGFTVEAGFGMNPLPLAQFNTVYKEASAIMVEALKG
jgi:g-D-glutamyl-meso-diaminopimelate peptidase